MGAFCFGSIEFGLLFFTVLAELSGNRTGIITPWMDPPPTDSMELITKSRPKGYSLDKQVSQNLLVQILLSVVLKIIFWGCIVQGHNTQNQVKVLRLGEGSLIIYSYARWLGPYQSLSGSDYKHMAQTEVEELVVHLEGSLDISSMEQGVKLVGAVLVEHPLNKWGVRNILHSSWREYGELQINWVKDNTYIIIVRDEEMASRILEQVPWAVMKQNFSVKRWPSDLALEEVQVELVPFWVQMKGIPLYLCTEDSASRLAREIGELLEVEDLAYARGFVRVRVMINTKNPLVPGVWLPRTGDRDT